MKATVITVAAASLLLLAGCGDATDGASVSDSPRPGSDTAQRGTTELTIVVRRGSGQGRDTYSLVCEPPGGDHPDPETACSLLDELDEPLAPAPADAMCTQIYGGPEEATVTGTLRGKRVSAEFDRTDGCEISRWDAHAELLVESGGAQGS